MEALLQELFIEGKVSAADYSPGVSAELTAALHNGRTSFPMASLLPPHSSKLRLTSPADPHTLLGSFT